jgi:hypothetical protein
VGLDKKLDREMFRPSQVGKEGAVC